MSLNLVKGQKMNLTKDNPGLSKIMVGLGWDANTGNGGTFDLDASVFLFGSNGKLLGPDQKDSIVCFANLAAPGIKHQGDNLTGAGDGDDEKIDLDLSAIEARVDRIKFVINIYQARAKSQNFGQVKNAYVRIVNSADGQELSKFDLSEDASTGSGIVTAELYRHDGGWKFGALAESCDGELGELLTKWC